MTQAQIAKIREALKDYHRPCEKGKCEYMIGGSCIKWDCVYEKTLIAAALKDSCTN
jgi:pyruvate/2-oxoglutarate dehydrogenase complex dihydrolipoamide dehydrogenase (E3) component